MIVSLYACFLLGLFSKAIAQSGSPIGEWAVQRRPRMYVERLALKLKCPNNQDSKEILKCLRSVDAGHIIDQSEDAVSIDFHISLFVFLF